MESWDPYTFNWIEKGKGENIFWDVGAWIGPFSLYASKLYNNVFSFEPDYVAAEILKNNIDSNKILNINLIKKGLYKENTEINFGFIGNKYGDSLSSINHPSSINMKINTIDITTAIQLYGYPDFIKIDIEGGEEYLIDDLIRYKFKKMCMSNHGPYMKK